MIASDMTVLTIDDEPLIRESISAYLEDSGFIVLQAGDGAAGLEIFRQKKPDIVLVDLRMPEVDGLDVLGAVTRESPETPIIVVSGTGVLQDVVEALRLGAWDYMIKPIQDMAVLEHSVYRALERAELLVENRKYREHLEKEIRKRTAELEERTRALEIANENLKREMAERRQTEAQLRQAQKMEAIGTLAGGIAHDFNNILFPIMGYTEMSLKKMPEASYIRGNLEAILKAATRAKDLVGQILAFSRHSDMKQRRLKVQPVIKEALKLLRATLPATIDIRQDIDEKCREVFASPTQIHQVMMNLCANAYHAMREKGGVLGLTLNEMGYDTELHNYDTELHNNISSGSYLRLTISDTGQGMSKEVMEKIFDPYFTTKGIGEGTGLGLSVVHGIIRNHSGHITVESEVGKGTTFRILFPVAIGTASVPKFISDDPDPKGRNENVLLVDDEDQIVDVEKQILEQLGYNVTARTNSKKALEVFRERPEKFDIVITDVTMPNMTGIELSREIMRIRPDIPIVLCTGFTELITEDKAKALGIREYVMKPMLKSEIARTIRQVLDGDTNR
ncbi:response regulator [Desulfococcaceae bacterium HSG8]|nr:response regulator [Desulfococcaceae bacterium HSG8]